MKSEDTCGKVTKWQRRAQAFATEADHWRMEFEKLQGDALGVRAERNTLLAWKARVQEAWERVFLASVTLEAQPTVTMCKDSWDALRQAIEGGVKPEEEEYNVGMGDDLIISEIAKCDVMCRNCHTKLHWEIGNQLK